MVAIIVFAGRPETISTMPPLRVPTRTVCALAGSHEHQGAIPDRLDRILRHANAQRRTAAAGEDTRLDELPRRDQTDTAAWRYDHRCLPRLRVDHARR